LPAEQEDLGAALVDDQERLISAVIGSHDPGGDPARVI
jgi:hypothetical protein